VTKGVGTLNTRLARSILVAVAAAWALALVACGGGSTTTSVSSGAVGTRVEVEGGAYFDITPQTLKSWMSDKDFLLVNVKVPYVGEIESTDEFIPLDEIEGRLDAFPQRDAKIVVYCRSGATSAKAAAELVRLGYTNVWNLKGGMIAWQEAGYPLISTGGP
jgi:rhodanese-related sulfurtransferase